MDIYKWVLTAFIQIFFVSNVLAQEALIIPLSNDESREISDSLQVRQDHITDNFRKIANLFRKLASVFPKKADTPNKVDDSLQHDDSTAEKNAKAKISADDKIFNEYSAQYKKIDSQCKRLLKKGDKLQEKEKQYLLAKQNELNQLKLNLKSLKPATSIYKKKQVNLLSYISSLIEQISGITIQKSTSITEDYDEIYHKNNTFINKLKAMDFDLEVSVEYKLRQFSLIRWRNKEPIYSKISAFTEAIIDAEKYYEESQIQFISKWGKKDKDIMKNLLSTKVEFKDTYNTLTYNASMYKKRMDELKPPYAILILTLFVLLITFIALTIYIRTYLRNRTIKNQKNERLSNSICSVNDEKETPIMYKPGLDDLRGKAKSSEYYIVDMNAVFGDTTIKKVFISRECVLNIYRFFLEFLKLNGKTNETGCFVIGRWELISPNSYNISLEEIIEPGNDAVYGEYELDFGTQIGIALESAILTSRQLSQNDYVHTCWIHSHPSIGLFLSNHDLIVQSQLVYSDHPNRMLAIVIDSNTENLDTAFFTSKRSGEMNNKEDLKTTFSFEKIAQWAKGNEIEQQTSEIQTISFDPSHYYECISSTPDVLIDSFLLSGSSIIDIDCMVNSNSEGLKGYLYGELINKSSDKFSTKKVIIENFTESKTQMPQEPVGCLLVLHQFTYQAVLVRYESIVQNYDFFMVYNPRQDEIRFISRNKNGKYLIVSERDLHPIPMKDLRKWTRRRRE